MSILYLDCVSGISGDMTVGALLDLGVSPDVLMEGLASLELPGWKASHGRGIKGVLAGTSFSVELDPKAQDAERNLPEIERLIVRSRISERAKERSLKAFHLLAEAEGSVHGLPPEQVHFHEVGAADSIVDLVGAAICVDSLAPAKVVVSPIPMARGYVRCRHGLIPLPAPATLALAKGVPICKPPMPTTRELATPTGLAIARAFADEFAELPEGTVRRLGYGLGRANFPWPNVLRALLLDESETADAKTVRQIEANIDDMSSEGLAHALERLMAGGALDVWLTPIHMKKGRPGFTLSVLCPKSESDRMAQMILCETTTLGVRYSDLQRTILLRDIITVQTPFGPIRCKVARMEGLPPKVKPEYEDCSRAAEDAGRPLWVVTEAALIAALESLGT